MANNLGKILDIISKVASVQQMSSTDQTQYTQEPSNAQATPGSSEPEKYIYISKEDLAAIFPGLADKLDINKLLPSLTSKVGLTKLLESIGVISVTKVEPLNSEAPKDEPPKDQSPQ